MSRLSSAILVAILVAITSPAQSSVPRYYGKHSSLDSWSEVSPWKVSSSKDEPSLTNWNEDKYRLPGDLLPSLYVIKLIPFLDENNFTIGGSVEIFVDCVQDTNSIVLNSLDITFDVLSIAVVEVSNGNPIALVNIVDQQVDLQQVTIKTASRLQAGKEYKISMKFVSILNDQLIGFYRSSYVENGVTKYLATTHMEPASARLAFPCFDEPNMKANFSIILGRKESMTSSSNMPLMKSEPIEGMPGYVWDFFETTPTMSSYLVAMLVSEFTSTPSDPTLSNVRFSVKTRPDLQPYTTYAANIGPRILEYFESYFGIDYPLAKEDMAAIPDFGPGAMENWGHMNFREDYLLVDEASTTAAGKQLVSEVISHELAHQWFGDLVTMDWWSVTWLNEGFARYLQYLGVDSVEPEYRMLELFPVNTLQKVFALDSLPTSHAMSKPVERNSIFDSITYDKGASVLRMCAGFLGSETFQRGLSRYLTKNAYENTNEEDLWNTLEEQASIDGVILPANLVKIMGSWTQNKNYPWIKVTRDYSGSIDGALVEQHRFVIPEIDGSTEPIVTYWWIPLTFTHDFELHPSSAWVEATKEKKLISLAATNEQWVIFNKDQSGFYRVAYDDTNYDLISRQLNANHSLISLVNRAQLLDDALNLAKIDAISYTRTMNLTQYLKYEQEYVPWHAAVDEFSYIDNMLYGEVQHADWKNYMTSLVRPYYNYVGFEESEMDAHLTILSRTDALNWACRLKIADCVQKVQTHYATVMENPQTQLSPNQRRFILCSGVENGRQAEWNFAFEQYTASKSGDYLVAITCTRESNILYNLLNMMLDPAMIRPEDVDTLFSNIAANPLGNSLATNFLASRWDDIEKALGSEHFVFFFRSLCDRQNRQEQYDNLLKLRDDHLDVLGDSATVDQGLHSVQTNIKWLQSNQMEIGDWLIDAPIPTEPTTQATTKPTTEMVMSSTESTDSESSSTKVTTPTTPSTTQQPSGSVQLRLSFISFAFPIALIGGFLMR